MYRYNTSIIAGSCKRRRGKIKGIVYTDRILRKISNNPQNAAEMYRNFVLKKQEQESADFIGFEIDENDKFTGNRNFIENTEGPVIFCSFQDIEQ